jgi:hypothetical protein
LDRKDGKRKVKIVTKEPGRVPEESVELRIVQGNGQKDFELAPAAKNSSILLLRPPAVVTPYQIEVTNTTNERIFFRLIIDGINTIVQNRNDPELRAVLLNQARGYILDPWKPQAYRTWIRNEGKGAQNREFEFAPAQFGVAMRLGKPSDMGTIIMAFYREVTGKSKGGPEGMLTREGAIVVQDIIGVPPINFVPEPMATVTIHYNQRPVEGK